MSRGLGLAALLVTILLAEEASANCAKPVSYDAEVTDAGVYISPENFENRVCPDQEGLVRENVKTGETVRIDACEPDGGARFVDTCVTAGQYRYGFARPYECHAAACSTDYFVTVDVASAPACVGPAHAKVPSAPWGSDSRICSYGSRLGRVGLGVLVVIIALVGAMVYGFRRMRRQKKPT